MKPLNIRKLEDRLLQIDWDDGETTYYPLEFLRRNCPCASCREARQAAVTKPNPLRVLQSHEVVDSQLDIQQAEVVGRYALCFVWSDGHREGIYTFDFLRELAKDEVCQKLEQERADSANS